MNTLSKICTGLTIVFVVSLVVLVAEVIFVLWRGRRFQSHGRNRSVASGDVERGDSFYQTPSKELLYYFCWKNQASRIEPDAETSGATASAAASPPPSTESELDELMKQYSLYGPSRVLFTIKEEEREEMETELSSAEREDKRKKMKKKKNTRGVSLEEITVAAVVIEVDDSTPFSTPCDSPPYYTPSPSPPRDRISPRSSISNDNVLDEVMHQSREGDDTVSLGSIEVHAS